MKQVATDFQWGWAPLAPRWRRPCECDRFAWEPNYIYAGFFPTQYEIQISHKSNSSNLKNSTQKSLYYMKKTKSGVVQNKIRVPW